jgi:hypothetical protein
MTRRGSIAYYLAAWVCGCVAMSVVLWLNGRFGGGGWASAGGEDFLLVTFDALIFGAAPALIGGFALRQLAQGLGLEYAWHWILAGGGLAPGLFAGLNWLSRAVPGSPWGMTGARDFLFLGAETVMRSGWWTAIPAGAFTALILFRVNLAFSQRAEEERQARLSHPI